MKTADWLTYFAFHDPTPEQKAACIRIRSAVGQVAQVYLRDTAPGPEQTSNLRKLKETQNALIGHIVNALPPDAYERREPSAPSPEMPSRLG